MVFYTHQSEANFYGYQPEDETKNGRRFLQKL